MSEPVKLHIGCGQTRLDGWINADLTPGPNTDIVFDAQEKWPFQDDSVDAVYASHVLEHLTDPLAFFREAWRVLKPVGGMQLRVPYGGHDLAWMDLTHVRPWYAGSLCILQPGYAAYTGNPQHDGWEWPFGVSVDLRLSGKFARAMRWWPVRKWFLSHAEHIHNFIEEMWIHAHPLKVPGMVAQYQALHQSNAIARRYVMYRHQWERRALATGEAPALVYFGSDEAINGFHTLGG